MIFARKLHNEADLTTNELKYYEIIITHFSLGSTGLLFRFQRPGTPQSFCEKYKHDHWSSSANIKNVPPPRLKSPVILLYKELLHFRSGRVPHRNFASRNFEKHNQNMRSTEHNIAKFLFRTTSISQNCQIFGLLPKILTFDVLFHKTVSRQNHVMFLLACLLYHFRNKGKRFIFRTVLISTKFNISWQIKILKRGQ